MIIITKETPLNVLSSDTKELFISKEVSLDGKLLEILLKKFPDAKITIKTSNFVNSSTISSNVLYNNDELSVLAENVNLVRFKHGKDITFDEDFTIEQAIEASKKLNEWENFINGTTIDGKPLSPLEKYTLAYSLVSNRFYKKEDENKQNASISRNLISVLTDDYIVCAGFANALAALCERVGIPCTYRLCSVQVKNEEESKWDWHANCIVNIKDPKYKVQGVFYSDPTWDSVSPDHQENWCFEHNINFNHMLFTHKEYTEIFPHVSLDTMPQGEDADHKPKTRVEIPNITALFKDIPVFYSANKGYLNPNTHELDLNAIKQQTFTRVCEHIDNTPEPKEHIEDGEKFIGITPEVIASYFMKQVTIHDNNSKFDILPYMTDDITKLVELTSKQRAKELVAESIQNLDDESILLSYMQTVAETHPEGNPDKYYDIFLFFRRETKPVEAETYKRLFKTLSPIMYELDDVNEIEQVSNLLTESYSPLTLKKQMQQKTQE